MSSTRDMIILHIMLSTHDMITLFSMLSTCDMIILHTMSSTHGTIYTVRKDIPGDILNYHHEGVKSRFHTLPLYNIPLTIIKTHQRLDPFPT